MASRKKLIQLLIYFFSSLNFSFSDIIIKNNTEWLRNKNITQNVIVKPGATLTIKEDVSIYIHNKNKESEKLLKKKKSLIASEIVNRIISELN